MGGYALEHNTRKMIINHILAYPGVSFGTIKKVLNIPPGTLRYHLNYLESKKKIKSSLTGNNRCYYPVQKIIFDIKAIDINATRASINSILQFTNVVQSSLGYIEETVKSK